MERIRDRVATVFLIYPHPKSGTIKIFDDHLITHVFVSWQASEAAGLGFEDY